MPGEEAYVSLRKRFARSFLDLLVLRMLARESLWGYRMMSMLRKKYGIRVGPPVIYPLLDSMEVDGLVESEEVYKGKRRRRVYRVTRRGMELIGRFKAVVSEIFEDSEQSV